MSARVLALRPRALGDVVLTTPALRALAAGHGGPVDVVTDARYAPLLAGLPFVGEVIESPRATGATLRLRRTLAARRYAAVVDFFGNPRTALLVRGSGAEVRAGYDLRGRASAYNRTVPRTRRGADGRREHASATHVRLALAAGGRDAGLRAEIARSAAADARAAELLVAAGVREPGRAIGLVAAGTWPTKTWPASHAVALARRLLASGREVVLLLGPGEERLASLFGALAPEVRALPPCGVAELAAVIARLGAVAGTDSGPRHLAAALGVPSVAWFGPTHPDNWQPPEGPHAFWFSDAPCRGCDLTSCPHWTCMTRLHPDAAAALVLAHVERHERHPARPDLGPAARA